MAMLQPVVAQIQKEGITVDDDLAEFDKETLQQIAHNLSRPGCRVSDPNYVPTSPMHVPDPAY